MIADMNGKTGQSITLKTDKNGLVAVRPYKRVSTVALKKINENWYLTREFASNPLILNWSNKTGRIQQVID